MKIDFKWERHRIVAAVSWSSSLNLDGLIVQFHTANALKIEASLKATNGSWTCNKHSFGKTLLFSLSENEKIHIVYEI